MAIAVGVQNRIVEVTFEAASSTEPEQDATLATPPEEGPPVVGFAWR